MGTLRILTAENAAEEGRAWVRAGVMDVWFSVLYCPKYHPMPYRSKKLVIIVSEFA